RHGHELAARGQTNVDSRRGRMERADHDAAARFVDVRPEERKGIAVAARNQRCTRRALRTWLTHGHTDPVPFCQPSLTLCQPTLLLLDCRFLDEVELRKVLVQIRVSFTLNR